MAYTKILVVHNRLDKSVDYAQNKDKTTLELDPLEAAIGYALNREKTETACFETALNCDRETVYTDMMATKERWGKLGRKRKGYHIIQSFVPGEVTPETAHAVGVELAQRLLGERYEVIVTTHLDKDHLHNHIVMNSVSFVDGYMYRDSMTDYYQGIRETSDAVCQEYGLSVIEPDPDNPEKRRSRPEWEGKANVRDTVRRDVDAALARAFTFQSLLSELRRMGYQVNAGNRKHISIRAPGGKGNIRLDSLGEGYTEADLKARLEGIRNGAVQPTAPQHPPLCPYLPPGRRYRVRGGLPRRKPKKLTGFQALCFKYLYLLREIKGGRPYAKRTAFVMRQEVIKFDRYQRQFLYLHENRIETAAQLAMQYDAVQAEIDALTKRRADLYRRKRQGEDTEDEIAAITQALRPLRRELRLCVQIEGDIPQIQEAVDRAARTGPAKAPVKTKSKTREVKPNGYER